MESWCGGGEVTDCWGNDIVVEAEEIPEPNGFARLVQELLGDISYKKYNLIKLEV